MQHKKEAKKGDPLLSGKTAGRVLNLFAYTCAFSLAALAGGARAVVVVAG